MDPQQVQAQQMIHQFAGLYFGALIVAFIIKVVLYIIPTWRIAVKAGKPGAISLLCAIPLVGRLITLYVLAFSDWKPVQPEGYYAQQPVFPTAPSPYSTAVYPSDPPPPPTQL